MSDGEVRAEVQALISRGNVTPAEISELRCNSWEWEALVPAMTDEALIGRLRHKLDNCSRPRRPCVTYDESVVAVYAPELLRRFRSIVRLARSYGDSLEGIREALGQEATHHLCMAGDVKELVQGVEECEGDGGCRATKVLRKLRAP